MQLTTLPHPSVGQSPTWRQEKEQAKARMQTDIRSAGSRKPLVCSRARPNVPWSGARRGRGRDLAARSDRGEMAGIIAPPEYDGPRGAWVAG